ncbi:coiled-coil domain-containing protein 89 [Stegastes partitus]|uniref:Coiled-coil domain-containing protein 89 n=1 Tax=Stegastes partitus TaxID=144197 RepID=A0A9Y4JU13_9TELE|nr:PREDICTED: coiled-coil domain-containing protein 89 [Stegastes partitus]
MASPQSHAENLLKMEGGAAEHMDSIQKLPEKFQCLSTEDVTERKALRSRIDEQSSLICILKQRADETLLRCQALQKINTELEEQVTHCQKELDGARKETEKIEKSFRILAANNQGIIEFMEEHKKENAQLKLENEQLQKENQSLFSQKLHDKEVLVQKLMREIQLLTEKYTKTEKEYREKLAGCESKLLEQETQHKAKERSLLDQLHDAHQQNRDGVEICRDLKRKQHEAEEQLALMETNMRESVTNLTEEKDKLLCLSMERGKVIQEKQGEIQQLETRWKEEKTARLKAQKRFELEAEAVNADVRVTSLQSALDESTTKFEKLNRDFDAFKEHSTNLLTQERELNKKLRHFLG